MTIPRLPSRCIAYFLICAGVIFGFILLAVYPYHKSLANIDLEIDKINTRIQKQKLLSPLYKNLLQKARLRKPEGLPFPEEGKLARNETGKISSILQEIADKSNLKLQDIILDPDSVTGKSKHLGIDIVAEGGFFDFRDFLMRLAERPYLEHIEQIQIQTGKESSGLEFKLKIWLAQELKTGKK